MGLRRGQLWIVHNKLFSVVVLFLLLADLLTLPAAGQTNFADRSALQQLSMQWGSALRQWSGQDPCAENWLGVGCDSTKTNVTHLLLSSMALSGTIPPAIGQLVNLKSLELSYNPELGGPLPTELGLLTNLAILSLQSCSFTGQIPDSLKNLKQLTFLALNGNQLSGPIPSSLGSLPSVNWFDLSSNNLSGPLPVSSVDGLGLDTMKSLVHIHLNNNSFSGPIPSELGSSPSLRNLVHLLLDSNSFSGQIPASLGSLPSLVIMRLDNNKLTGSIPTTLQWTNQTLQQLNVANNNLTGVLPDLSALHILNLIDFSNNPFTDQPIPSWLTTLPLQSIVMEQAGLSGPIPSTIFDMPNLQTLNLGQNKLNGTLTFPPVLGPNLTIVALEQNDITGFVPSGLNLTSLILLLGGNPICTITFYNLPPSECSLDKNETLGWVSPTDTCPGTTCSGAQKLNPNVCSCAIPMIVLLELRSPRFRIVTPAIVLLLKAGLAKGLGLNISQVWVESAIFTDNARRVNCSILFFPLNATQDQLSLLDQIYISSSLAEQNVTVDLMFVPYRVITAQPNLLNLPGKSGLGVKVLVGIIVAVVVVLAMLIGAMTLYAVIQKRRADRMRLLSNPFASWGSGGGKGDGEAPKLKGARWFRIAELKVATDDFNESNEIGVGGYGKVYRAILPSGEVVAVKRARESSMQGGAEFKNEIELLSRVHHKNLVGLVGFCFEEGEQLLVYEFMSLGTVQQHLRGRSKQMMDWRMRMTVALGSARGLAYLHELANPPIIHHDVKTTNILLNDNMVAKVADFGISKLVHTGNERSIVVKGTVGYMDPEYYMTQMLTASSDVYSFGVVLLELITGRHPIEYGKFIVREVKIAMETGGLPALESMLDPYIGKYTIRDLETYRDLALSCVEDKAADRPTMMAIVQILESLVGPTGSTPTAPAPAPAMRSEDLYTRVDKLGGGSDHSNYFQYSGDKVPTDIEPH